MTHRFSVKFNTQRMLMSVVKSTRGAILRQIGDWSFPKDCLLLDIGCGDGSFSSEVSRIVGASCTIGLDMREEDLVRARTFGVEVVRSDFNTCFLPFRDSSFHVVMASQVIELTLRPLMFLKEIKRVLKRQGLLVLSTPNLASLHNSIFLLSGKPPPMFRGNIDKMLEGGGPGISYDWRTQIFTLDILYNLISASKFNLVGIYGVGYYPFPQRLSRLMASIDKRRAVNLVILCEKHVD